MLVGHIIGNSWKKNGLKLELTLATNSKRLDTLKIIKQNLETLGIKVKINEINDYYYKNNLQNLNYDILLTGNVVSIKPDLNQYIEFNIESSNNIKEIYDNAYKEFALNPSFIGLYFNSIIIVHSKNLKGNFTGNWYNIFYNINTWHKILY